MRAVIVLLVVLAAASPASAQTSALTVQVVDPSGAGIPHAIVIVKNELQASEVTADVSGVAAITLAAGSYEIIASAEGFEARSENVRLSAGRPRRLQVELPLSKVLESLTVTPEPTTTAETTITSEEIDALGDDPEALEQFINDVGGPEATVSVDGFRGGRLPPKEQVAQLVVTSDPYSAQFHEVGSSRVDVITKPGFGKWEGRTNISFSSDALGARNPFASEKLPYRNINGWLSASGPIARLGTSVSLDAGVVNRTETRPLIAITPQGLIRNEADALDERYELNLRTTHAIGTGGILRNRIEWESADRDGAGLGDVDLPERALSNRDRELTLRSSLTNQLPRRIRQELRVSVEWNDARVSPVTEAIAIDVLGAFRSGGAQATGSVNRRNIDAAAEWLFPARGRHTLRTGLLLEQTRHESTNVRNYLGTFVFAGLDAYRAGEPTTFTQRVGSVDIRFSDTRTGLFVQDDVRLTEKLTAGIGIRQEFQPSIDDVANVAPRFSLSWTTKARAVLRFGIGAFYTWHDTGLIEEAQRLDGTQSYERVIRNPGYPDPLTGGSALAPLPPTRLITADDLSVARVWRASATFERRFVRVINLRSTVYRQVGGDEPRARNVNAPINGVRPDLASGNVLVLSSTGRSRRFAAETNLQLQGLWRRRLFGHVNYTFGELQNDADGALSLPADNLAPDEWGPARQDVRHRGFAGLSFRVPNSFNVGFTTRWQSAAPYNITIGEDLNGDTVTNDRPIGVRRNAGRGVGYWTTDLHVGWTRAVTNGSPREQRQRGGGPPQGERRRGEIGIHLSARNVFNNPQYGTFNGVISSPLFGQPVSAQNPRRIDLGFSVSF